MKNIKASGIIIMLSMLILTLVCANLNWGQKSWRGMVRADAKGYYAYLPAAFIYKDLNFGFFDHIEREKYADTLNFYDYRSGANGYVINKYFVGTAVAQLPFFAVAHGLASECDGYSRPYLTLVSIAGLFYILLALIYLNKWLRLQGFSERVRSWVLVFTVFGTNLFYYAVGEPGLSHVFSLAFIAAFCYYTAAFVQREKAGYLLALGFITGMCFLIRPVNVLVLLSLPFLAGSREALLTAFKAAWNRKVWLIGAVVLGLAVAAIQAVIYKVSCGTWWVYSYGEEGFNWGQPHVLDILFSYKKGLFLYTPMYLLALFGLWKIRSSQGFQVLTLILFLAVITYVLSSWWNWWYGGSFSSRVYVDYLPFFAWPLAHLLSGFKNKVTTISVYALAILLLIVCQIQIFQYRYYHIHWENMNREMYWQNFLRIDRII